MTDIKREESKYILWLNHLRTINHPTIHKLIKLFGNEEEVYINLQDHDILDHLVETKVIKEETKDEILFELEDSDIDSWYAAHFTELAKRSINVITYLSDEFPDKLKVIHDNPVALYYRGDIGLLSSEHIVAVIGTRRPTIYGREVAEHFARELASRGIVIVSGLAAGIDTYSHNGAISAGGKTIGVLGGSVDICYPRNNFKIYNEMCKNHLVISEYPPGVAPLSMNFPMRNRIISGISDGVLVVEAGMRSGTIITSDRALEQGKVICAIPGRIDDVQSQGTNYLIRSGAFSVCSVDDVICDIYGDAFNKKVSEKVKKHSRYTLTEEEAKLYSHITLEPVYIDDLIRVNNLSVSGTIAALSRMERAGIIKKVNNSYYIKNLDY